MTRRVLNVKCSRRKRFWRAKSKSSISVSKKAPVSKAIKALSENEAKRFEKQVEDEFEKLLIPITGSMKLNTKLTLLKHAVEESVDKDVDEIDWSEFDIDIKKYFKKPEWLLQYSVIALGALQILTWRSLVDVCSIVWMFFGWARNHQSNAFCKQEHKLHQIPLHRHHQQLLLDIMQCSCLSSNTPAIGLLLLNGSHHPILWGSQKSVELYVFLVQWGVFWLGKYCHWQPCAPLYNVNGSWANPSYKYFCWRVKK